MQTPPSQFKIESIPRQVSGAKKIILKVYVINNSTLIPGRVYGIINMNAVRLHLLVVNRPLASAAATRGHKIGDSI